MKIIDAELLQKEIEDTYCKDCEYNNPKYNGARCRACPCPWADFIDYLEDAPAAIPEEYKPELDKLFVRINELIPDLVDSTIKCLPGIIEQMNYCKTCGLKDYFNGED